MGHNYYEPRYDAHRTGVARLRDIEDMIVKYESSLCKDPGNFNEPLLHMMYLYRRDRFVLAMLTMTEGLMHTIANCDPSRTILRYLVSCEPPSYSCQRYWDWIEPHLVRHIQHCTDNQHIMQNREEMEVALRIHQLVQKIKDQSMDILTAGGTVAGRALPQPYLIWDILGQTRLGEAKLGPDQSVHVLQHELECLISPSKPTGSQNQALHKIWTNRGAAFAPRKYQVRRKKPKKWVKAKGQAEPGNQGPATESNEITEEHHVRPEAAEREM